MFIFISGCKNLPHKKLHKTSIFRLNFKNLPPDVYLVYSFTSGIFFYIRKNINFFLKIAYYIEGQKPPDVFPSLEAWKFVIILKKWK